MPVIRRVLGLVGLVAVLFPLGAGTAAAHGGGIGPEAHVPRIIAVEPPVPGLEIVVIEAGERLRIDNGTSVVAEVLPPGGAARTVEPVVGPGETARWMDTRVMSAAADPQPVSGSREWAVPMRVGEQVVTIRGEQIWPPAPPAGLWWLATLVAAVAVATFATFAVGRPRWTPALAVLVLVVACAHVIHVVGSALVIEGASVVGTALGAAGPALLGWVLALVGAALTVGRRSYGPLLCALSGAILALVTAFAANSFAAAVLPFAWSPDLDRLTVVLTLGGGLGLFLAGFAALRELTPAAPVGTTAVGPS